MKSNIATVTACILLSACASKPAPLYFQPSMQIVNTPEVGEVGTAEIGETMISKVSKMTYPAIELKTTIQDGQISSIGSVLVPTGIHPLVWDLPEGRYFSNGQAEWLGGKSKNEGIFVPNNPQYPAKVYHFNDIGNFFKYGVAVQCSPTTYSEYRAGSFKRELIYNGQANKAISITYREFSGDMARPAFNQDLKYDLNDGAVIGFRGARFEVIKATNTEIKFRTISPLN